MKRMGLFIIAALALGVLGYALFVIAANYGIDFTR